MSWLPAAKHLAVLVSVVEGGLSIRKAAAVHGVHRVSVHEWAKRHRNGQCTIEMLREQGVKPMPPVAAVPDGRFWHQQEVAPSPLFQEVVQHQKQQAELLKKLVVARDELQKKLAVVRSQLAVVDDQIKALGGS